MYNIKYINPKGGIIMMGFVIKILLLTTGGLLLINHLRNADEIPALIFVKIRKGGKERIVEVFPGDVITNDAVTSEKKGVYIAFGGDVFLYFPNIEVIPEEDIALVIFTKISLSRLNNEKYLDKKILWGIPLRNLEYNIV